MTRNSRKWTEVSCKQMEKERMGERLTREKQRDSEGEFGCLAILSLIHVPRIAKMKKSTNTSEPMFHSEGVDAMRVLNSSFSCFARLIRRKTRATRNTRTTLAPTPAFTNSPIRDIITTVKSKRFQFSLKYAAGPNAVSFNTASDVKTATKNRLHTRWNVSHLRAFDKASNHKWKDCCRRNPWRHDKRPECSHACSALLHGCVAGATSQRPPSGTEAVRWQSE